MITFWQALVEGLSLKQRKDDEGNRKKSSKNNP